MVLKDIIAISGTKGLFKLIKPTRNGLLLEAIDEQKRRTIKNSGFTKIISLENVAIYSTNEQDAVPLSDVFVLINKKFKNKVDINHTNSEDEIRGFMEKVLPVYDSARVHPSQILKLSCWYNTLTKFLPELFNESKDLKKNNKSASKKESVKEQTK